jgi:hypothetical protein
MLLQEAYQQYVKELAVGDSSLAIRRWRLGMKCAARLWPTVNRQRPNRRTKKESPPHAGIPFEVDCSTGVRVLSTMNFINRPRRVSSKKMERSLFETEGRQTSRIFAVFHSCK